MVQTFKRANARTLNAQAQLIMRISSARFGSEVQRSVDTAFNPFHAGVYVDDHSHDDAVNVLKESHILTNKNIQIRPLPGGRRTSPQSDLRAMLA